MFAAAGLLSALASTVAAGTVLWDGRFNDVASTANLAAWSWSNQVGPYQYYIHGNEAIDRYIGLSPDFKNPADTGSSKGVKVTIDDTAHWNGQPMFRTELIPQTSAAINSGKVFYHFSVKTSSTNPPNPVDEHQIAFFESHFTELLYGAEYGRGGSNNTLRWAVNKNAQFGVDVVADQWHNFAYEIDFTGKTVALWYSAAEADLKQVAGPVTANVQSDGKDWHVGLLRMQGSTATEDWYFSGVYIENEPVTTKVSGPGGAAEVPAPADSASSTSAAPVNEQAPTAPSGDYGSAPDSTSAEPLPTGGVLTTLSIYSGAALVEPLTVATAKTYLDAVTASASASLTAEYSASAGASLTTYPMLPTGGPAPTDYPDEPLPSEVPPPRTTLATFDGPALTTLPTEATAETVLKSLTSEILSSLLSSLTAVQPEPTAEPTYPEPTASPEQPTQAPQEPAPPSSSAPVPAPPVPTDALPSPTDALPSPITSCTTTATQTIALPRASAPSGVLPGLGGTGTGSPIRPTGRPGGYPGRRPGGSRRRPWWWGRKGRGSRGSGSSGAGGYTTGGGESGTAPSGASDSDMYAELLQKLAELQALQREQ